MLLLAAAAPAAVKWVVKGRGFGHGVGMSQYGAYGYARHGKGHRFILRHYYRGTSLGKLGGTRVVRVLLEIDGGDVGFTAARGACGQKLEPGRHYEAHLRGNGVRLRTSGGKLLERCGGKLRAAGRGRIRIGGVGAYRGALEVVPTHSQAGALNVINAVSVNQYVKGVVSNEMPSSWPMAALQTQAVASRSYALTAGVDGNGFDLYDDTSSQVYGGIASESKRGNHAASSTRNQVVRYAGAIAETFFFACSGGRTESVENVFFGNPVPYLKSVSDPYDYYCPLHDLEAALLRSRDQLPARLRPGRPAEADRRHQAWGLPADRLGPPLRHGRRQQDPRRLAAVSARRIRPLDALPQGRRRPLSRAPLRSAVGVGLDRDAVIGLAHTELVRPAARQAKETLGQALAGDGTARDRRSSSSACCARDHRGRRIASRRSPWPAP